MLFFKHAKPLWIPLVASIVVTLGLEFAGLPHQAHVFGTFGPVLALTTTGIWILLFDKRWRKRG